MQQPPKDAHSGDAETVERAIVLQVLRDDRHERWSRSALARELSDCEPALVELALARLQQDGVLAGGGTRVCASTATRRLDELELVGV
jgi:hypothetical protein